MEDPEYFNIGEYFSDMEMYCLLSGGDKGILMSGQDTLWQYLPATGEVAELLDWKDANVNIDGYGAETIIFEQEEAGECLTVLCNDTVNDISEISKITYKDSAYVPQRTIITMGLSGNRMAEDWVNRFNRSNDKYTIEIKMYDDLFGLAEDLLYNPEEVPDLMDITWVDADMLNSKGLLEDLTPYFEKSELVKKEDILEQIWDMCSYEGKLTSIMCYFDFGSCTTIVEDIPENGWTYDEFLALDKKYPDSRQLLFNLPYSVWSFLDRSGANTFVDWDKKECNYDSEEFRSLLTQLKDVKTNSKDITSWSSEDEINWMLSGEYLIREIRYRSPYDYLSMEGEYEGKIKDVGYPTIDGTPCYLIEPSMYFSIYSESENKDGAWAFIEFMLTEEEQTWYGVSFYGFPVRKENFESYLTRKYSQIYSSKYNPTDETAEIFRNMLEHSQMVKGRGTGEVRTIVWEELEAFHAGAKTAEETAEIIKNRVQLYLDENF